MNLQTARVVGYFSLPSPQLAEVNPTAYNLAMASAPAGAGSCAHCSTGILHHVVVEGAEGEQAFIGTTCALKVGSERIQRCVRERITDQELLSREAKQAAGLVAYHARVQAENERLAARWLLVADQVLALRAVGSEFHRSLADQFASGPLSGKQARYAVTGLGIRYSKKTAELYWDLIEHFQS